jgi:hypothetical protein
MGRKKGYTRHGHAKDIPGGVAGDLNLYDWTVRHQLTDGAISNWWQARPPDGGKNITKKYQT